MNDTVRKIENLRGKINKLEKDFKKGVPDYLGFTIDVSYGGNKEHDIEKIVIGSVSDDKEVSKIFYNLILKSLKNSLKFYKKFAEDELKELTLSLNKKDE